MISTQSFIIILVVVAVYTAVTFCGIGYTFGHREGGEFIKELWGIKDVEVDND